MWSHHFELNQVSQRPHIYEEGAVELPAGSTCLHMAVALMCHPQVEFLLGASNHSFVEYRNTSGQTAEDMISLLPPLYQAEYNKLFESWKRKQAANAEGGDVQETASTSISRASDTLRTGLLRVCRRSSIVAVLFH